MMNAMIKPLWDDTSVNHPTEGEMAQRFLSGFKTFLSHQYHQAVLSLLKAELPGLAQDDNFMDQVVQRLTHNSLQQDTRFIFLSLSPQYKAL